MSEILSREQTDRLARDGIEVRRLAYCDLPAVISIERRSFPTPWSLAMFVLELSKPSGICLAAERGGELAGYVVCSRYDQVWHLMNVAVSPDHRAHGVAGRAAAAALRGGPRQAPLHARGPRLQPPRDRHVRILRLPLGRRPSPLLPRQRRGRADHVAGLKCRLTLDETDDDRAPGDRDLLRRHLRRRARRRADPLQRDLLAGRRPRGLRRGRPRGRRAPSPGAGDAGGRGGAGRGGGDPGRDRGGRRHRRAGADRRAPGRGLDREGDRRRAPAAADPGRPPAGPRRRQLPRSGAARAAVPLPGRLRRAHDARRGPRPRAATRSSARPSTTPPARPSTSPRACSASATRAGRWSRRRPRAATRKRSRCRWRCSATPASTSPSAA